MEFAKAITAIEALKDNDVFYIKYKGDLAKELVKEMKGHTLTKVTETLVVKGIEYAKQKTVVAEIENGKVLTHKLPWGEWNPDHKNIIDHKGNHYLRMYFPDDLLIVDKVVVAVTKYFFDGAEVDKAYLKDNGICKANFFEPKPPRNCMDLNIDNIIEIELAK